MTEFKFIDNTGAALALLMTAAQDYCLIGSQSLSLKVETWETLGIFFIIEYLQTSDKYQSKRKYDLLE